mmetsp:Transcript_59156/g.157430  ORF Transcript_59156/g.157430 Transcript_59156/m.157430 type:complete len:240 (+) Transcript_59156:356-1075(+)
MLSEACPHDGTCGREHLTHARATLRTFIANHDEVPLLDLASLETPQHTLLILKDIRWAGEGRALLASDLCDSTLGANVPAQDLDVTSTLNALVKRPDHVLILKVEIGNTRQVLGHSLASHSQAVTVQPTKLQQILHDDRCAAYSVRVLHEILTAWFEIREECSFVTETLEVVDRQVNASRRRHREQMKHRVRGTSKRVHNDYGVLEGLLGDYVQWLQVSLKQRSHHFRHLLAFRPLLRR